MKLAKSSNRFISRDSNGNRAEGFNHDVVQLGGAVRTVALQSTTTRVTLTPEELRRRCSMAALRLQMLGPTQSRDPISSIGGQPHQPREEQAHYRI